MNQLDKCEYIIKQCDNRADKKFWSKVWNDLYKIWMDSDYRREQLCLIVDNHFNLIFKEPKNLQEELEDLF